MIGELRMVGLHTSCGRAVCDVKNYDVNLK